MKHFFIENQKSHLTNLVAKHPLNFVAYGLLTGGAEMDLYSVSGLADFLHKRGAFVFLLRHRNRAVCSDSSP